MLKALWGRLCHIAAEEVEQVINKLEGWWFDPHVHMPKYPWVRDQPQAAVQCAYEIQCEC